MFSSRKRTFVWHSFAWWRSFPIPALEMNVDECAVRLYNGALPGLADLGGKGFAAKSNQLRRMNATEDFGIYDNGITQQQMNQMEMKIDIAYDFKRDPPMYGTPCWTRIPDHLNESLHQVLHDSRVVTFKMPSPWLNHGEGPHKCWRKLSNKNGLDDDEEVTYHQIELESASSDHVRFCVWIRPLSHICLRDAVFESPPQDKIRRGSGAVDSDLDPCDSLYYGSGSGTPFHSAVSRQKRRRQTWAQNWIPALGLGPLLQGCLVCFVSLPKHCYCCLLCTTRFMRMQCERPPVSVLSTVYW